MRKKRHLKRNEKQSILSLSPLLVMMVFLSHCTIEAPKRNAGIEKLRRQTDAAKRKHKALQKLADEQFEVIKDYRKEMQRRRAEFVVSTAEKKARKAKVRQLKVQVRKIQARRKFLSIKAKEYLAEYEWLLSKIKKVEK